MPTPSVARNVHYIEYDGGPCRAGIITEVGVSTVGVYVMAPNVGCPIGDVAEDPTAATGNTWHWPEVVA